MTNVKFLHLREDDRGNAGAIALKGGKTIAYKVEDNLLTYVVARCGKNEHFNRKLGNKIAGGRLQCERAACQKKYVHKVNLTSNLPIIELLIDLEG